ncbi:MAG: NfeD family protein [Clostridia bacterium]|nr:NfeD family protein [Clostridia bacterium]
MGIFEDQLFTIIMWAAVFVIALTVELATTELVSVWFCGGALVSLIFAAVDLPFWAQLVAFTVLSTGLLVLSRLFWAKKLKGRSVRTNTDALIGQEILITKAVADKVNGAGRFRDVVWTVESSDAIEVGDYAVIKEIRGNKLIVEKKR